MTTKAVILALFSMTFSLASWAQDPNVQELDSSKFGGGYSTSVVDSTGDSPAIKLALIEPGSDILYSRVKTDGKPADFVGGDGVTIKATIKHTSLNHCVQRPVAENKVYNMCYFSLTSDGVFQEFKGEFGKLPNDQKKGAHFILAKQDDRVVIMVDGDVANQIYGNLKVKEEKTLFIGDMKNQFIKATPSFICQAVSTLQEEDKRSGFSCLFVLDANGEPLKIDQQAMGHGDLSRFLTQPLPVAAGK